ncbi:MAG TPA: hypothetical protein VJ729_12500 [Nitrososphaeraceae archaeon]|nr:hypothetical protein [Nitrososphaeraceae archaeon]
MIILLNNQIGKRQSLLSLRRRIKGQAHPLKLRFGIKTSFLLQQNTNHIRNIRLKEMCGEGEILYNTKTGGRPMLLTYSFSYVRDWLNQHPF